MLQSVTGASLPENLRRKTLEVQRSKLRYVDAGRRCMEKVLFKPLGANDNIILVIFVNFVCNL
jgi:hypothetical protein